MAGNSENDNFDGWAWAFLISAFILPLLIVAGAVVSVVAALFWLIGKLILGPLKGPISRRIDIERILADIDPGLALSSGVSGSTILISARTSDRN